MPHAARDTGAWWARHLPLWASASRLYDQAPPGYHSGRYPKLKSRRGGTRDGAVITVIAPPKALRSRRGDAATSGDRTSCKYRASLLLLGATDVEESYGKLLRQATPCTASGSSVGETPGVPSYWGDPGAVCAACYAGLARDPHGGDLQHRGTPSSVWSLTPPAQPGDSPSALHHRCCATEDVPRSFLLSCLSDTVADSPCVSIHGHELLSAPLHGPIWAMLDSAPCSS